MTLDGEALEDFKRRYEIVFNRRLSDEEARELEADLKHLYRIVRRRSAADRSDPPDVHPPWLEAGNGVGGDPHAIEPEASDDNPRG